MKLIYIIFPAFFLLLLITNTGCEQPKPPTDSTVTTDNIIGMLSLYTLYTPVKIDIMPLTEFTSANDTQRPKINVYVSLLDPYGSQIKSPGKFRFELYEYIQRSAEPKGKRAIIWPDVDLTNPVKNNDYWRDFLRAYVFSLPYEQAGNQDYILQVTCLCPNGKRLSTEFTLRQTK
ncbi:MAG TPA: hypothetical protein DIU00_08075 [Phycisphaerales bacterium]|nr:hypothetical protein [Phycisphaerales bacterium]